MRKTLLALLLCSPLFARATEFPAPIGENTARTYPYAMIGQVLFNSGGPYIATGTVINPRSVLTAAHALYDRREGWSTNVRFRRSTYGSTYLEQRSARRLFVLARYQELADSQGTASPAAFSKDLGGVKCRSTFSGGSTARWSVDTTLLTGSAYNIALGYGAVTHSGDKLLYVEPTEGFYQSYKAFYENDSIFIEAGMSGGPLFAELNNELFVAAVIVSGSEQPYSGGVRVINGAADRFIRDYLP